MSRSFGTSIYGTSPNDLLQFDYHEFEYKVKVCAHAQRHSLGVFRVLRITGSVHLQRWAAIIYWYAAFAVP